MDEDLTAAVDRLREGQAQVWRDALDLLVQLAGDVVGSEPSPEVLAVAQERSPAELGHLDPLDVVTYLAGQTLGEGGLVRDGDDPVDAIAVTDWLVLVSLLAREGVGAPVAGWAAEVADLETPTEPSDVEDALAVLAPVWRDLGLLDDEDRLTATGLWVLPHAFLGVWGDRVEELEGSSEAPSVPLPEEDAQRALDALRPGPLTVEDLAVRADLDDPDRLWEALRWRAEVHVLPDGLLLHVPTALEGVVLTHRLSAAEVALGAVDLEVDLAPWQLLAEDEGLPLAAGGEVVVRRRSRPDQDDLPAGVVSALVGPDGWLAGAADGELWGFRLVGGALEVGPVDAVAEASLPGRLVDVVGRATADLDPPGVLVEEVVLALVHEAPDALATPRPPLAELLDDERLSVHGSLVGPAGTRWVEAPDWLAEEQHDAYAAWREAVHRGWVGLDVPEDSLGRVAGALHDGLDDLVAAEVAQEPERAAPVVSALRRAHPGATTTRLAALVAEATGDGAGLRRSWPRPPSRTRATPPCSPTSGTSRRWPATPARRSGSTWRPGSTPRPRRCSPCARSSSRRPGRGATSRARAGRAASTRPATGAPTPTRSRSAAPGCSPGSRPSSSATSTAGCCSTGPRSGSATSRRPPTSSRTWWATR